MKGEELKKRLTSMGYGNISELARLLGLPSSQNLYAALSAQDVKTGLVEDIARVIDRPVTDFYHNTKTANNSIVVGDGTTTRNSFNGSKFVVEEQAKQITMLVEELTKSGKRIDTLLNIISNE